MDARCDARSVGTLVVHGRRRSCRGKLEWSEQRGGGHFGDGKRLGRGCPVRRIDGLRERVGGRLRRRIDGRDR